MQDLRMYLAASLQEAADDLIERHQFGAINAHELGTSLSRFVLRDIQGIYFAYDGRQQRWYRHMNENWQAVSGAPECLEGPTDLPVDRPPIEQDANVDQSPPEDAQAKQQPTTQVLQRIAKMIAEAYAAGQLNLLDASEILQDYILLDRQGRPWMPGVRTGTWYAYTDGTWKPFKTPPADEDLISLDQESATCRFCGTALDGQTICPNCHKPVPSPLDMGNEQKNAEMLKSMLEAAGTLPEALSEPWEPPAWYPDAIQINGLACPACQEENRAGSNFCSHCGIPLAVAEKAAEAEAIVEPKPARKFCTTCGAPLAPGRKFCTNCGKAVA